MSILAFAEQHNGIYKKSSFEVVSQARKLADQINSEVIAVVIGNQSGEIAADLVKYGANKIYAADQQELKDYSTEAYTQMITEIAVKHHSKFILIPATAMGKDLAPRVAARLKAGLASDVTGLNPEGQKVIITRPVYAGKVLQKLILKSEVQVISIRPNVFKIIEKPVNGSVEKYTTPITPIRAKVTKTHSESGKKIELTEADIIVTGGRGMKSADNWHLILDLANSMNGAFGASRAVVDGGWRPHDEQVGQTGKTVSPQLYFACGISGAIQHVAGMASSKCIVAINTDPEAPIFKISDYGIIGDAMEVLPVLTAAVKKIKNP
jgi:electron transfer flavoprotein alpha subunit